MAQAPPPDADPAPAPPPPAPVAPVARSRRRPRAEPALTDPAAALAPAAPAPRTATRGPRASDRVRRQQARQHQLEFEQLSRLNDVIEEEMVAQVMALTAEQEGTSGSGQPLPVPTPAPGAPTPAPAPAHAPPAAPAPAAAPAAAPAPLPTPTYIFSGRHYITNGSHTAGLSALEDPDQLVPCTWIDTTKRCICQCRICRSLRGEYTDADWEEVTDKRARTERSSVGSGDGTCSAETNPGWLGGVIKLQAMARRALAMEIANRLRTRQHHIAVGRTRVAALLARQARAIPPWSRNGLPEERARVRVVCRRGYWLWLRSLIGSQALVRGHFERGRQRVVTGPRLVAPRSAAARDLLFWRQAMNRFLSTVVRIQRFIRRPRGGQSPARFAGVPPTLTTAPISPPVGAGNERKLVTSAHGGALTPAMSRAVLR